MITLSLLHPIHLLPVQSWTFNSETVIRIGRAKDNNVVLYNALVAPYHAQLHRRSWGWEIESLSSDGTYTNHKTISRCRATNSMILRLTKWGPRLHIQLPMLTKLSDSAPSLPGESGANLDGAFKGRTQVPPAAPPVSVVLPSEELR